jgi:hypothetical protein
MDAVIPGYSLNLLYPFNVCCCAAVLGYEYLLHSNCSFCCIPVLEVYQFARDAAVAEAWLIAQEPYLMSQELGVSFLFLLP